MKTASAWTRTFSSLRIPNYRYFYLGQSVSLLGTAARTMAMGWVAFNLTHSEYQLGLVYTLHTLPNLLFSVYAGSVADRFSKLLVFKVASWTALISSLALAILVFSGHITIGELKLFALFWGTAHAFEMPSRQALMMELVGPKDLVNAISLNSAMVNASRILGPALGGPLLAAFGPAWCFLLDGFSFLAVLYGLYRIRLRHEPRPRPTNRLEHLLEGMVYVLKNPLMLRAMLMLFIMSLGGWAYQSQLAAFVKIQLGQAEWGYVFALSSAGLGSCVAALLVATHGERLVRESTLYGGVALFSFFIFFFGFQKNPWAADGLLFWAAFGLTIFFSTSNSLLQTQSPSHLRGRIMGLWAMVFGGGMPIGSYCMGWLAGKTGSGTALQAGGIFCFLMMAGVYLIFKRTRE